MTEPPSTQPLPGGGLARYFVQRREIGWLALAAVLWWGLLAVRSLPQQEDPTFPRHDALIITVFPGATASQVEQLVTAKVEAELAEFEPVEEVRSESRANVSVVYTKLHTHQEARIAQAWDELRAKLQRVTWPDGCVAPRLDTEFQATATLLLSIVSTRHGPSDLERSAERLQRDLQRIASVGRVRLFGEAREQVELRCSTTNLFRSGVTLDRVAEVLAGRNAVIGRAGLPAGGEASAVHLSGELTNDQEIEQCPLAQGPGGTPIRVRDVCDVWRGVPEPASYWVETLYRDGQAPMLRSRSVLLAVEMRQNEMIGRFATEIAQAVERAQLPEGMQVLTVSDQPAATAARLRQFARCFVEAMLIVVLVCGLLMNWRTALVLALAVPLTLALTFGGMALLRIPLQQISVASLIIALGMLVDDPVVAADGINRELAAGRPRETAAWFGPYRLRRAILFGTIINIVAFLPLALLPGDMGAFIIALPLVMTLALAASRLVSMTFIPLLGYYVLRGQRGLEAGGEVRRFWIFKLFDLSLRALLTPYKRTLQTALRHPVWTLAIAYGLLGASFGFTVYFGQQFFPPAERHQCLIDIQLPLGSSVRQSAEICARIARVLERQDRVASAVLFCGGTAPNFYYNVLPREPAPHLAQVLINTRQADEVPPLIADLRAKLDEQITNATCVVRALDQGPALEAPIMIRLRGDDLHALRQHADSVIEALAEAGAYKISDDLGQPVTGLTLDVNEEAATVRNVKASDIARVLQCATSGLKITELRQLDRLVPVVLRLQPDACDEPSEIAQLPVPAQKGEVVCLGEVAKLTQANEYVSLMHEAGQRAVTVKAFAPLGELASRVLSRARAKLDAMKLPPGYTLEYAGEARELTNSQREMQRVVQISLALIALSLVVQFGSVLKALVVMLTVPLGLAGAFAGLALTDSSFGFMALLGIVSLAGVIVSHIIVLSDFIEEARSQGMELQPALEQAGLVRLRAVLVTVLATVCGLIPLALQGGELWQPLTAVHIFGLLLATALTLVVLPVWYYLFAAKLRWIR